jgi:pilus assembly protein CpaE
MNQEPGSIAPTSGEAAGTQDMLAQQGTAATAQPIPVAQPAGDVPIPVASADAMVAPLEDTSMQPQPHQAPPQQVPQQPYEQPQQQYAPQEMQQPAPMPVAAAAPVPVSDDSAFAAIRARPIPRINIQAFCVDQRTGQVIQQASQDRRLSKAHVTVQAGGIEAALAYYRNAPTPNLVMIESMHRREEILAELDQLAEVCDSGTKVIVIGHVNDVLLYRELLQRGISEYLVMPLGVGQVMECISRIYTDPEAEPLGRVIAFLGAKGGAGSSTVCHNVGWAISEVIQSDVVIADFDLPFGTAGLDFNQDPVQGLADALSAPERVDEVMMDRLLSRCSDHLSLFTAPGTLDQAYDLSAGACNTVVDVLRKNVPYVTADLPHLWTDWARQVAIQADHIVITAVPDLANLRNAKNLMEKLGAARPNDAKPLLVLNQVGIAKRPEISPKDFAKALETEPVCVVDFDANLFGTAANNGQMIEEVSQKAKAAEQFRELAQLLADRTEAKAARKSLLGPILSRFSRTKKASD